MTYNYRPQYRVPARRLHFEFGQAALEARGGNTLRDTRRCVGTSDLRPPVAGNPPGVALGESLQAAGVTVRELLDNCPPNDPMRSRLEQVHETVQRLAALAAPFGAAPQRHAARATSLDLNTVVRQLAPSLQGLLGPFISFETDLHSGGLWAAIDRGQVEQVALGLVLNAREALPLGGRICVSTRRRLLDQPRTFWIGSLAPGDWALLEVADNGTGVDEQTVRQLFEPSLRGLPIDSSLSLATVSAIVRDAGGQIVLDATPGGGTMLAACFPAMLPRRIRQPATGTARAVLVVDDDEWSRLSAARTLRRAGYGVLEAEHADAALELLDDVAGSCVSLVVVDARLASAGARPLGARIRQERPDVEVLMTASSPAKLAAPGDQDVLEKPFTPDTLLRAVRERLPAPR